MSLVLQEPGVSSSSPGGRIKGVRQPPRRGPPPRPRLGYTGLAIVESAYTTQVSSSPGHASICSKPANRLSTAGAVPEWPAVPAGVCRRSVFPCTGALAKATGCAKRGWSATRLLGRTCSCAGVVLSRNDVTSPAPALAATASRLGDPPEAGPFPASDCEPTVPLSAWVKISDQSYSVPEM